MVVVSFCRAPIDLLRMTRRNISSSLMDSDNEVILNLAMLYIHIDPIDDSLFYFYFLFDFFDFFDELAAVVCG